MEVMNSSITPQNISVKNSTKVQEIVRGGALLFIYSSDYAFGYIAIVVPAIH